MNPKNIAYLDQFKRVSTIAFRSIFCLYWIMKIVDLANDKVLNSLIILSICIYVIRFSIQSFLEWNFDKEFHLKQKWLSVFYLNISLIIFCYYYEILEITPFIIQLNLGISFIVVLYVYFKNRNTGST